VPPIAVPPVAIVVSPVAVIVSPIAFIVLPVVVASRGGVPMSQMREALRLR
jgi:hypothetical protein